MPTYFIDVFWMFFIFLCSYLRAHQVVLRNSSGSALSNHFLWAQGTIVVAGIETRQTKRKASALLHNALNYCSGPALLLKIICLSKTSFFFKSQNKFSLELLRKVRETR